MVTPRSPSATGAGLGCGVLQSPALQDAGNAPHNHHVSEGKKHEPPGWQGWMWALTEHRTPCPEHGRAHALLPTGRW